MEMTFTLETLSDTARVFLVKYKGKNVFAFHGEMGAGKTTFIHALCDVLKVTGRVTSPTFSIINEYRAAERVVYHVDLYRIKDDEEAIRAGVEDCLYSGNLCFVEWPSKAPSIFPDETVHLHVREVDPRTRTISDNDK
jgi:tRNA threonylcarbamoyladenosine biosynthesis protein TsaE